MCGGGGAGWNESRPEINVAMNIEWGDELSGSNGRANEQREEKKSPKTKNRGGRIKTQMRENPQQNEKRGRLIQIQSNPRMRNSTQQHMAAGRHEQSESERDQKKEKRNGKGKGGNKKARPKNSEQKTTTRCNQPKREREGETKRELIFAVMI